jgi:uncharacterized lipoprotein YddW (UPF0748 family)
MYNFKERCFGYAWLLSQAEVQQPRHKSAIPKLILHFLIIALLTACAPARHAVTHRVDDAPKHEFRGAWIQTAWQSRYQQMNSAQMRQYISEMIQRLYEAGINAVIFQVRPEGDAFYKSDIEPWSRFLTGQQGQPPDDPTFDPLAFIIEETHRRGMELHAWLNPYRAQTNVNNQLAPNHLFHRYPERFFQHGNQLFFDPGLPENRAHIVSVVRDIVSRYNVDAIHFDDYFYPYPIAGEPIPDDRSFNLHAAAQGFSPSQRGDWRRNNVNLLIKEVRDAIAVTKPWVRFGVSPFGIFRNRSSYAGGSDTNGLQNYDDLYADIKLWLQRGWIDYNVPQLYWEIGHRLADYTTLLHWWNDNSFNRPLYIGQCIERSMNRNELGTKVRQAREMPNVSGNMFWYAYRIAENRDGIADLLKNDIHRTRALIPPYTHLHAGRPNRVRRLTDVRIGDMHLLTWRHNGNPKNPETPQRFVVYRFRADERVNINRAENIVAVTPDNFFILPRGDRGRYTYAVTSLDAFWNESRGRTRRVRF